MPIAPFSGSFLQFGNKSPYSWGNLPSGRVTAPMSGPQRSGLQDIGGRFLTTNMPTNVNERQAWLDNENKWLADNWRNPEYNQSRVDSGYYKTYHRFDASKPFAGLIGGSTNPQASAKYGANIYDAYMTDPRYAGHDRRNDSSEWMRENNVDPRWATDLEKAMAADFALRKVQGKNQRAKRSFGLSEIVGLGLTLAAPYVPGGPWVSGAVGMLGGGISSDFKSPLAMAAGAAGGYFGGGGTVYGWKPPTLGQMLSGNFNGASNIGGVATGSGVPWNIVDDIPNSMNYGVSNIMSAPGIAAGGGSMGWLGELGKSIWGSATTSGGFLNNMASEVGGAYLTNRLLGNSQDDYQRRVNQLSNDPMYSRTPVDVYGPGGSGVFGDGTARASLSPELATQLDNYYSTANRQYQTAQDFDRAGHSQAYLENLHAQAAPGQEEQVNRLFDSLYGSGLQGSTLGAQREAEAAKALLDYNAGMAIQADAEGYARQQSYYNDYFSTVGKAVNLANSANVMLNAGSDFGAAQQNYYGLQAQLGAAQDRAAGERAFGANLGVGASNTIERLLAGLGNLTSSTSSSTPVTGLYQAGGGPQSYYGGGGYRGGGLTTAQGAGSGASYRQAAGYR